MSFRFLKLRRLHILLIGFLSYLVIFNMPEVLLHITSIGVGGHETEVAKVLVRIVLTRILIFCPIAFLYTFILAFSATAILFFVVYLPLHLISLHRKEQRFTFSNPLHNKLIIATACTLTCAWKLGVEVSDPQTSQRQFKKDIGVSLPTDAQLYRAFHRWGGYKSAAMGFGKDSSYQFKTTAKGFSDFSQTLALKPLIPGEGSGYSQLDFISNRLPTPFHLPVPIDSYEAFVTPDLPTRRTGIRTILYHKETGWVLITVFSPPR